jgi:microcin C transport system ATP-binding protein
LLEVDDLSVAFRQGGAETLAVDRVSFALEKGETLALVGESGSGKSVSALSILRLLPYPAAEHPSGSVRFKGRELLRGDDRELLEVRGNDISMIFQEPMTSLNPLHTVSRQIGEVLRVHQNMSEQAARARTIELLDKVGIADPETRLESFPHQLSGGQRQRVMIAMALANDPDLLIADEPTTALDVTVQAQVLELLRALQRESGMAMLLITHDLGIVRHMADNVAVMQNGRIVETGPVGRIFEDPQHDYTKMLLAAEPKGQPPRADTRADVVLEAQDLKVWFPVKRGFLRRTVGHIKAVDGVDLTVRQGQTLGVVGESGSGKTTLGLAICGSSPRKGASPMPAPASTATMPRPCGRCARRCRWCSRTRMARCRRGSRCARSSKKGCWCSTRESIRSSASAASRARWRRWGSTLP